MGFSSTDSLDAAAPRVRVVGSRNEAVDDALAVESVSDLRLALLARAVDDREIILYRQGRIHFQIAGAGHEALCVGLARHLKPASDWFFPYYRDLALVLALGVTPTEVLLQATGSVEDPASGGRQMPHHWGHRQLHIVTQSSPTGSQCLPAIGCAEAGRYLRDHAVREGVAPVEDEIVYVSLGEGAAASGEFWESLNLACLHRLPVMFVVADNGYAISVPSAQQRAAPVAELVRGFPGLSVWPVDGSDYFAVRAVGRDSVARLRAGEGPCLVHATVPRLYSHSAADSQAKYRSAGDLERDAARDPIAVLSGSLLGAGILSPDELDDLAEEARALAHEGAREALAASAPDSASAANHLYVLPRACTAEVQAVEDPSPVSCVDAINRTLHELMRADERVRVFGEDVADGEDDLLDLIDGKGGVFGATWGLQRMFGSSRCYNTPVAEAGIVGRAVGQGVRGLKPIPEIQFFDFLWPAMQQLQSEAATIRWRSNGAYSCPMILRVAIGGYIPGGAIWHSQCAESILTHVPGLLVAFPSRARDAVGLLRYAHLCEDPVLFLEHKHLYRQPWAADPFPPPDYVVPFGRCAVDRVGRDITIVTWGAMVDHCRRAAAQVDASIELIDLRTLVPWDKEGVERSVVKTGRLLVVHEDMLTGGFGAEVAAWVGEHCFETLDAPVQRLGAADHHVGYHPNLVNATLPQTGQVVTAINDLMAY